MTIRGDECPFSNLSPTPTSPLATLSPPSPGTPPPHLQPHLSLMERCPAESHKAFLIPLQADTLPLTTTTTTAGDASPHGVCPAELHKAFLTPFLDDTSSGAWQELRAQNIPSALCKFLGSRCCFLQCVKMCSFWLQLCWCCFMSIMHFIGPDMFVQCLYLFTNEVNTTLNRNKT